ncbi:MAG: hypothetical protein K2H60_06915 [Muribaculaceae bacterium]|nr:hypothetical protein [Muribaculaceae bacterium]
MIIDGEELNIECRRCGHRYTHIIGYGPICPTPELRRENLRKYPPVCPRCKSSDYKVRTLLDSILDFFK